MLRKRRTLYWVYTLDCQVACRYCFKPTTASDEPTNWLAIGGLVEAISDGFDYVIFTGGEALLSEGLFSIATDLRTRGTKTALISNGLLIAERATRKRLKSAFQRVSVSIDSLDEAQSRSLRGPAIANKQSTIIGSLRELRDEGIEIGILQTITARNPDAVRPMADFCMTEGFDLYPHPVGESQWPSQSETLSLRTCSTTELAQLENDLRYWAHGCQSRQGYADLVMALARGKSAAHMAHCPMGSEFVVLQHDGSILPCFHRDDLAAGNVRLDSQCLARLPEHPVSWAQLSNAECVGDSCVCLVRSRKSPYQPTNWGDPRTKGFRKLLSGLSRKLEKIRREDDNCYPLY